MSWFLSPPSTIGWQTLSITSDVLVSPLSFNKKLCIESALSFPPHSLTLEHGKKINNTTHSHKSRFEKGYPSTKGQIPTLSCRKFLFKCFYYQVPKNSRRFLYAKGNTQIWGRNTSFQTSKIHVRNSTWIQGILIAKNSHFLKESSEMLKEFHSADNVNKQDV